MQALFSSEYPNSDDVDESLSSVNGSIQFAVFAGHGKLVLTDSSHNPKRAVNKHQLVAESQAYP